MTKISTEPNDHTPKKQSNFKNNFHYYLSDYFNNTCIHGCRYLGEPNRKFYERIWWLISIAISLGLCITLTWATYNKWQNAPVIVSFATKETPIWQIPFPAVTLCPETKSIPSVFNYTKYMFMKKKNITLDADSEKKFEYLSLICKQQPDINYMSFKPFASEEILDFFHTVQPKFYNEITECKYLGKYYNCSDLFLPIITDEGLCYVFNLLDRTELLKENVVHYKNYFSAPKSDGWSLERGYPVNVDKETYPKRALFAGASFALEAKLTVYEDEMDYFCGTSIQGFKVQISHPSKIPRVKEQHFRLPVDQLIIAAVAPDMMTTSDMVKNYNPQKRNCYFPSERHLKFYKIYSQQNCEMECKANYTHHKCGCVNFFMPRDNLTLICNAGKIECMKEAGKELMFEGIDKKLSTLRGGHDNYVVNKWLNCDCLPVCTSMYYIVENSQSDWDWRKLYDTDENPSNTTRKKHMSFIQVFFKGNQFITSDRNELFGITDFIANFGGLLGLFIGFSLLSLIEVVYYLTLRLICNIRIFGKKNWSGKTD